MDPKSSRTGAVLLVVVLFGAFLSYWFYTAAHFADGNNLDINRRSFLPINCAIASDRAADIRESAQAYFLQGNVRIDLQLKGEQTISAHEIVKSSGADYAWRDDSGYGKVSGVQVHRVLQGVAKGNEWFCFPWFIPEFSKFDIPGNITFQ